MCWRRGHRKRVCQDQLRNLGAKPLGQLRAKGQPHLARREPDFRREPNVEKMRRRWKANRCNEQDEDLFL